MSSLAEKLTDVNIYVGEADPIALMSPSLKLFPFTFCRD